MKDEELKEEELKDEDLRVGVAISSTRLARSKDAVAAEHSIRHEGCVLVRWRYSWIKCIDV